MAEENSKLVQSEEYLAYVEKMTTNGGKKPSVEEFLETLSLQEATDLKNKYNDVAPEGKPLDVSEKDADGKSEEKEEDKILHDVPNLDRIRSQYSDQNEIMIDRIRVKVLQSMNLVDASVNVDNLEIGALIDEVKKADNLKDNEKIEYEKGVEENLKNEMVFNMVPPKTLVKWSERVKERIAAAKKTDLKVDVTVEEGSLKAVEARMDALIKDITEGTGLFFVDQTNIVDVYDGYAEMIAVREKENKLAAKAKTILDGKIGEYDKVFGLAGKTASDAGKLQDIAQKSVKTLKDFELSPDMIKVAENMVFKDEKGNDAPQFLDPAGKPAMIGIKVRPDSQLATLIEASKTDALQSQVLVEGKEGTKAELFAAANDAFLLNATMLINADRIGHKEKPIPFAQLSQDLKSSVKHDISAIGFEATSDAYVNRNTSMLARLGKKVGPNAQVLGTLYEPIRKMDKLEKERFGDNKDLSAYRTKFWTGLAANAALVTSISAGFAVASKIPGGQVYCAYASVGLAATGMAYSIYRKKQQAKAEGKKYGVKEFFSDGETMSAVLMSGVACAAVAWGRPELLMATLGGNAVRTGYFAHKKSKQAGIGGTEAIIMAASAAAITPLAVMAGQSIGHAITDYFGGNDGAFGHWEKTPDQKILGEDSSIKTYDQKHIDKAEVWNNSDGQQTGARYTADGSALQESAFHKTGSYNDALSNVQANHQGWASEAADVNMAKLENAHLLGAPNTPLAYDPSKTLGDIMGAIDPATGQRVTYQDVFTHLTTNPQTPLSATESQVMDLVAQHISADANGHMGHLIPDVGIKPQDLYSYDPSRPDGIQIEITKGQDINIPGKDVWVENPDQHIIPYIPPYFLAQAKKLKQIKEKIGSLADKLFNKKVNKEAMPVKNGEKDGVVAPKKQADKTFNGIQGDNVFFDETSGEVSYNEVEGLDDKKDNKKDEKPTKAPYVLTDKDMQSPEYSEALSAALNGDAKAIEKYRQKREIEVNGKKPIAKDQEIKDLIAKNKARLQDEPSLKGKISGAIVADEFAREDIERNKGVKLNENTSKEYIREEKEFKQKREADKSEFKKTGKIDRLMNLFKGKKSR